MTFPLKVLLYRKVGIPYTQLLDSTSNIVCAVLKSVIEFSYSYMFIEQLLHARYWTRCWSCKGEEHVDHHTDLRPL